MLFKEASAFALLSLALACGPQAAAADSRTAAGHAGEVLALAAAENGSVAFTACSDGYIVGWDLLKRSAIDRFQLGPYALTALALRPGRNELAVIENDGYGLYRVSAWNFTEKKRLFALRFRDAVSRITYSEKGTYLIVARNAYDGIVMLDPETGNTVKTLQEPTSLVNFISTGRSERTMVTYSVSGDLNYWNMATGSLIERVKGAPGLSSTSLFGNGRFLFGTAASEMVISDAVNGREISRKAFAGDVGFLSAADDGFRYLRKEGDSFFIGKATVSSGRQISYETERLVTAGSDTLLDFPAAPAGKNVLFATRDGRVALVDVNAAVPAAALAAKKHLPIDDVAHLGGRIAALVEGRIITIPPSASSFKKNETLKTAGYRNADRLLSLGNGQFLFWKSDGSVLPMIDDLGSTSIEIPLQANAPLISVQRHRNMLSFLDAFGTLTVYDRSTGAVAYRFTSIGLMDAAFIDERRMVLAKSGSVPPFVPLMVLNYRSGETVPLAVPGKAAIRLYRGESGSLYSIVAETQESGTVTRLLRLDPDTPAGYAPILEYRADDVLASIAEAGKYLATTLGGDGISILKQSNFSRMERTSALPRRIVGAGTDLLSINDDGSLSWHNTENGKTAAVLRFSENGWELSRGSELLTGRIE